ncbi:MAG: stage II sporulation protein R, partial [Clostridia bacterium]|nr:stage II sporulation protein R [Clostridia bacterium]
MKKFCISFILVLIIILTAYAAVGLKGGGKNAEYLRIHIRADSNSQQAQAVKYKVKDAVVEFLTPIIAECGDKQQAEAALKSVLPQIEKVADEV